MYVKWCWKISKYNGINAGIWEDLRPATGLASETAMSESRFYKFIVPLCHLSTKGLSIK